MILIGCPCLVLCCVSDIVSFTALASRISPEDVVAILNVMFSTFDSLSTKHNIYKVRSQPRLHIRQRARAGMQPRE